MSGRGVLGEVRETAELLEVADISKKFAGLQVLSDVSLHISAGERVGLIGPNGAGKTTLFNVISGSLRPDGGRISFAGRDITKMSAYRVAKLGIARTFQIPQPFAEMTVADNVAAALRFGRRGDGKLPRDPDGLLRMVRLDAKSQRRAGSLTVSEMKRLEVARALALSPELLMLDEFAAGLSPIDTEWASGVVGTLSKDYGLTIIWTEHVMRVLMKSVDRVLVLQQGKMIAQGSPDEIVRDEQVLNAYFGAKQG